jgi:hypothetical protein
MAKGPKKEPRGRPKPEPGGYAEREYGVQGYYGQERGGQWGQFAEGEQGFRKMRKVRGDYGSEGLEERKRELQEKPSQDGSTSSPKANSKSKTDRKSGR